jgi:xylulokinase
MSSADPLFLGLDLSTQQLKAILLNKDSKAIHQIAVHFDRDLPHHGTTNGAIQGPDKGEVTSPVQMWLEAVDLLFARLHGAGVDLGAVMAVSGAGQVCTDLNLIIPGSDVLPQQHGSVYWSTFADSLLSSLDPDKGLAEELFPKAFSYVKAPIWQDSSTTEDCKRLEDEFGGAEAVANRTGSRAYERFTGNQISRVSYVERNQGTHGELVHRSDVSSQEYMMRRHASLWSPLSCPPLSGTCSPN